MQYFMTSISFCWTMKAVNIHHLWCFCTRIYKTDVQNVKVKCVYTGDWKDIYGWRKIKIFGFIILIFYSYVNENVLQWWIKEEAVLFWTKLWGIRIFKLLHFDDASTRGSRSNDKLESVRDAFESGIHICKMCLFQVCYWQLGMYTFKLRKI